MIGLVTSVLVLLCLTACGHRGDLTGAPRAGECRSYSQPDGARSWLAVPPVPCSDLHSAETFFVARSALQAPSSTGTWPDAQVKQAGSACTWSEVAAYLGLPVLDFATKRFALAWFAPSPAQARDGARWLQCDVVIVDDHATLTTVQVRGRFGPLARAAGGFADCATEPTDTPLKSTRCRTGQPLDAAIEVSPLPGRSFAQAVDKQAITRARAACARAIGNAVVNGADLTYTVVFPTEAVWRDGRNVALCWMPLRGWAVIPAPGLPKCPHRRPCQDEAIDLPAAACDGDENGQGMTATASMEMSSPRGSTTTGADRAGGLVGKNSA